MFDEIQISLPRLDAAYVPFAGKASSALLDEPDDVIAQEARLTPAKIRKLRSEEQHGK